MRALVAGILSFLIIYLFDWASIKRVPGGKQAIAFLFLDVLYVSVRDRFFFPRMFPDYPQYQRQTPMLIPTRESISACFSTLKAREALR